MTQPLVAIGVPCGDRVHKEFMECLWALGRGARNHRQGLVSSQSSMIVNGRNNIVQGAREIKADYLMFIDSDMIFPYDTIDRLLAHAKHIVGATYVRRGPPFDTLGKTMNPADATAGRGLVRMTHMPTGMLLIKMSVFDNFPAPIFRFEANEAEGVTDGEDMVFSRKAMEHGFGLWCDCDLSKELGHMYQYALRVEDPALRASAEAFRLRAANG